MAALFMGPWALAADDKPAKDDTPPELATLRAGYEGTLMPYANKLDEAIKARAERYAKDLAALAEQVAGSGKVDGLEPLKAERDAYAAAGHRSAGFDEENKKAPPAARELRRNYDRDLAKIRVDLSTPARPAAVKYVKDLTEMEATMVRNKNVDGILAVRHEKQAITQVTNGDPLFGGDKVVLGGWQTTGKTWVSVKPNGTMTDQSGASGQWEWDDRGKRKIVFKWKGDLGTRTYTLTPDGGGMVGTTSKRVRTTLERQPPSAK